MGYDRVELLYSLPTYTHTHTHTHTHAHVHTHIHTALYNQPPTNLTKNISIPLLAVLPVYVHPGTLLWFKILHHAMHLVFVEPRFLGGSERRGGWNLRSPISHTSL